MEQMHALYDRLIHGDEHAAPQQGAAVSQPEATAGEELDELQAESGARPAMTSAGAIAQSVVAKLLIVGLNAATGILSARSLAPAGRGALTALTLWPIFLGSALTFGIPSALTYSGAAA